MTDDQGACGCCSGLSPATPERIENPAGQSSIDYRFGVHQSFKESLLAGLSNAELPALSALTTREDSDLSIALCDALAASLDVLTFYQERIANECFLRTATERLSVLELARLIGYELAPGVASAGYLAFTLQEVPGSPALAAGPVVIPVGTRVQSIPGPGEQPQVFETDEATEARAEWNGLPVQTMAPWRPQPGDRELWLAGVGLAVAPGDSILLVGQERIDDTASEVWDMRLLTEVREYPEMGRTRLRWATALGTSPHPFPPESGVAIYVFRQRASLFGHNAPDPRTLSSTGSNLSHLTDGTGLTLRWRNYQIQGSNIYLDSSYPKIVPGSWFVLISNASASHPSGFSGRLQLYRAQSVTFPSRTAYAISAKVTRLVPDNPKNLDWFRFRLRATLALAQSEPLPAADIPLAYPLYGSALGLAGLAPDIGPGRRLGVSGKRARIKLRAGRDPRTLVVPDGDPTEVVEGDSLRLAAAPERRVGWWWAALAPDQFGQLLAADASTKLRLTLLDRDGRTGRITDVPASDLELAPAEPDDEVVQEVVQVGDQDTAAVHTRDRTTFTLMAKLRHCYDRKTALVNANLAHATHGESVNEVLGSGDARVPNLELPLRQGPLTHVSAPTASGRRSTLSLRINDLLWEEVDSMFARQPSDRVFEVSIDAESRATVRFGDGVEGARPPSGDHNIRAAYRKGLGSAGNLGPGKLTNLLSRPLGVTGSTNPEATFGGEDPERESRARQNAPLTVRTLERAVSIRDYEDYGRGFPAVAKAHALYVPSGPARGVFLTVAGEGGTPVAPGSDTYTNLLDSLRNHGDHLMPVRLASYQAAAFRLRIQVRVAPDADVGLVLPAVAARLQKAFGFEARGFGKGVSLDEVVAVAQGTGGVEAVNVTEFQRTTVVAPNLVPRIFAALPVPSLQSLPLPAEILTIDSASLVLGLMP